MIRVGYYQFAPLLGDKKYNLMKIKNLLNEELPDILVLPELFNTGYCFSEKKEVESLAEEKEGETYWVLKEIAQKKNIYIYGGFIEKEGNYCYNSAMLVAPDGRQWIYRKPHLFFEENLFFTPGNTPLEPIAITIREHHLLLGLLICFDWFFPETARTYALKGAHILLHTANLVLPYCPAATITRALENRVFIVLADRVGIETSKKGVATRFTGLSRIVSPRGEILVSSDETSEEIKIAQIVPEEAENKKINPYNDLFLQRRVDLYQL